ncbi:hypothetical protein [Aquabacterium parvum]|uniref:hypothetical protein n=1 Tax=Aquabacterium parvum TaxID=70584 RepID=UPI00128F860F|nr:hypothetical protein [Aquabacterium parvum]
MAHFHPVFLKDGSVSCRAGACLGNEIVLEHQALMNARALNLAGVQHEPQASVFYRGNECEPNRDEPREEEHIAQGALPALLQQPRSGPEDKQVKQWHADEPWRCIHQDR